jgi:hypothetical protein
MCDHANYFWRLISFDDNIGFDNNIGYETQEVHYASKLEYFLVKSRTDKTPGNGLSRLLVTWSCHSCVSFHTHVGNNLHLCFKHVG